MAQRTRSDSATKDCTLPSCDRPLRARGLCSAHYKQLRRAGEGKSHHKAYLRVCETCGSAWSTPRPEARFCTAKCKGVFLSSLNKRKSALPVDHPVMVIIATMRQSELEERRARRAARAPRTLEWRTPRQCPGCACWFTPLATPTMLACSKRCARRAARWRRNAAERGATGSFTWSEFMHVARRFRYCCAYCGVKPAGLLDPDHVVPLSRGGSNSTTNLLPACRACNGDKRDLYLDEWAIDRERRGLPPRATNWAPEDKRYWHLTSLAVAAA